MCSACLTAGVCVQASRHVSYAMLYVLCDLTCRGARIGKQAPRFASGALMEIEGRSREPEPEQAGSKAAAVGRGHVMVSEFTVHVLAVGTIVPTAST
jgi:hypothetical protein